ncbi:AfsR/SARP family transcriptional regulator [Streptomyces montanus]|uniref:AfsR/SARP family transcriptional regulator n=1 Tax=Streptomyces montanus TaxID=2580423 RepID=A0A5R9FTI8_9ACTN|nr:BTAD domain-containing putative transcriptional regulator [Streptomyces montanus]TLS42845.1 AfsR/SARP family transcriptional regulator [Streptomyces montanus]
MDPVRYRILGTTQAFRGDGTPLTVGGARLRALLTVLALRPGRALPAALLVDEVWGADPPADATGALQALVGRLRRVLGSDAIGSTEGGYRLRAAADDVDLHRFERLAGEGTRALGDGDPAKAAVILDDALALWHGPALADLPDHTAESARWETRRLDVRRARFSAALALGHAQQVLPDLTALCDAHPLDEALQLLRLRALREAGRTAEALAAYEDVRQLLADRLGADPGPELRALHAELLRQGGEGHADAGWVDQAQGRSAGGPGGPGSGVNGPDGPGPGLSGPRSRLSGPGGSPGPARRESPELARHERQFAGAGRESAGGARESAGSGRPGERSAGFREAGSPAGPGATPPPGNLRARLTSFVGRDSDIETIREDLAAARLVTLLGPGGAGKTRLSQEAAETVRDAARDGVWLAELAPVDGPDAVPEAVLTAVGARETVLRGAGAEEMRAVTERHDDPVVRLTEHCGRRRMLLILDNCEHVVDAAARLVEELLARCPELTVLATSREPLGVPGELLRPVEPLPEPYALRLLADRGAAARPGFRVEADEETAAACAEICRRLDGLPLAIELAAARLRMLTPRQIADRLDDRFRLLTSGSRTVLPRQQTLRAVVDWSWDLLDEDERDVLRRLSVFAGGCDLAAAEAVCGPAAFEALGSLVDKSLVVTAPSQERGEMRYRLLETVAEYAGERLDEAGVRKEAERAHLTYYRELARTTDPLLRGAGQRAAIERFQLEYENLRTALRRAVADRDEQEALCLVLSLGWYWQMRDLRLEGRNWATEVKALGPDPFTLPLRRAAPLWERCTEAPPPMAGELLEEARRGVHLVHLAAMDTEMEAWKTPEAQEKLRVIAQVYEPGQPQTCRPPGFLWFYAVMLSGDVDRLHQIVNATVDTCRSSPGYEWELATCLQMRANILANRSDWAGDASCDADESLEIFLRIGDAWGAAEALSARGEAHERRGDYDLAAADYAKAMENAERLGARAQVAILTARLGSVLLDAGEAESGERLLREVIERKESTVNEAVPAARLFLAGWLGTTGRNQEAREILRSLREEFAAASFVLFEAFITGAEAWLDITEGQYEAGLEKARLALEKADDQLSRVIAPHMRSAYLTMGAAALAGLDGGSRARDAARCIAAADAMLPPGHVPNRWERVTRDRTVEMTRAALGDEAYEAAYAEGGGLSPEEATALV